MSYFVPTKFKIYYIHQVPGRAYEAEVPDAATGELILEHIYQVALYQFENNMIPDYANTGGVLCLDEDGEWIDYDADDWEVA